MGKNTNLDGFGRRNLLNLLSCPTEHPKHRFGGSVLQKHKCGWFWMPKPPKFAFLPNRSPKTPVARGATPSRQPKRGRAAEPKPTRNPTGVTFSGVPNDHTQAARQPRLWHLWCQAARPERRSQGQGRPKSSVFEAARCFHQAPWPNG